MSFVLKALSLRDFPLTFQAYVINTVHKLQRHY